MKKIAILITSMLLFVSAVCIIPVTESDGAVVTKDDVLPYEVYKVNISTKYAPNIGSSNPGATQMTYFRSNDVTSQNDFEEALRNHSPLPASTVITWNGNTEYDLTVYVLGPLAREYGYDDRTSLYLYWSAGYSNYTYHYIHEGDRLMEFSSAVYLLSGQTVKITAQDIPSGMSLGLVSSSSDSYDYEEIEEGENEIKIKFRGNYSVCNVSGTFTYEYISYTIEYETVPTDTSAYGYAFLVIGILFLVILIWFALPQKIKD